jgi:hypothetical protein
MSPIFVLASHNPPIGALCDAKTGEKVNGWI